MKKQCAKLLALFLTLALLIPSASALTVEQARELLREYYVDEIPPQVLEQPTIEEMLTALGDPYTEYFDAEANAAFLNSMKDTVTYGLGITMRLAEGGVLVVEVIPDLGAERAGIKPGDLIIAVDGQDVKGLSLDGVSALILGEEGTTVDITLLRDEGERSFTVTRLKLVIPATEASLILDHIGYLSCTTFGPETVGHFEDAVTAHDYAASRWIVDLRGNGGGDIWAAVNAAGTFAGGGHMAYLRGNDGQYKVYAREEDSLTMDPVVVVTDAYTASASEMFAFIVRDGQAGVVVGERTYGKGVAQTMLDENAYPDYFVDGDALKITTDRVFSYGGVTDDKVGIIPHLMVDGAVAADVAVLLSGESAKGDTTGKLRLDMTWRWYLDTALAAEPENHAALTALLEAIPEHANLWRGTGGPDGWAPTTPAAVAEAYGLTDYTPRAFTDTADSPYAAQISALCTYGVISGGGDGTYRPEDVLTRGELCALLAKALRYTSDHTGTFPDVAADAYYASAVEALYAAGIVTGGSDGLFHPDTPIDHQQYMTILARVGERLSMSFHTAMAEEHAQQLEHELLLPYDKWARESVWLLEGSQTNPIGMGVTMLWESLSDILPHAPTTRGEAAAGLYNLLTFTGILP